MVAGVSMKYLKQNLLRTAVSCLFILALVINFQNALVFQTYATSLPWKFFLWGIGTLFFVLNIATAFGLIFAKRWGYWLSSPAILFSSIFFSTAYIPFLGLFFRDDIQSLVMMASNSTVLVCVIYLHTHFRVNHQNQA